MAAGGGPGGCTGLLGPSVLRWWYWITRGRPDVTKPIRELRRVTAQYTERESVIAQRITEKTAEARRLAARARVTAGGEKDALRRQAMMALRQRGQLQGQLARTTARHLAIESQVLALEDASLTTDTLGALRSSSRILEAHGKILDVDRITSLLSRLEGQMEASQDLSAAFTEHGDAVTWDSAGLSEEDLEAELVALEADGGVGEEEVAFMPPPVPVSSMGAGVAELEAEAPEDTTPLLVHRRRPHTPDPPPERAERADPSVLPPSLQASMV